MPTSVIIADDHPLVRQAVNNIVEMLEGFECVAQASNGIEAVTAAKKHEPDLMILDIAMPYANGVEVIEEARRWSVKTIPVILTGLTSRALLAQAKESGAKGLFLKSEDTDLLLDALPRIAGGEEVFSPKVTELFHEYSFAQDLSSRERQVLQRLALGESISSIADHCGISPNTVDKHRTNIMKKLGVHSYGELMALALREGLIEPNSQL